MRKRNVQVLFRLSEDEAMRLDDMVKRSGRTRESFIRAVLSGYSLREKPEPEFYKIMRELSAIGNRLNQLTIKAHAYGFIDAPILDKELKEWQNFRMEVRRKYILPEKIDGGM